MQAPPVFWFRKQFPIQAAGMLLGDGRVAASHLGRKYVSATKFLPRLEQRGFSLAWTAGDPSIPLSPRPYSGFSTLLTGLGVGALLPYQVGALSPLKGSEFLGQMQSDQHPCPQFLCLFPKM